MKIIEELQKFGLTKIEAQVYYELLKNPDSNGSQISKKIDTPRTSVYMALEKLYSLGFIYLIPSLNERKNYMAADPDKLVMKLKSEYMRSAEFLENELLKIHIRSDNEQFINLRGEENILDKIKEILNNTEKEIYMNTNINLMLFETELENLLNKGGRVILFSFEKHKLTDSRIEAYNKTENYISDPNKRLMLVSDMKEVIIGSSDVTHGFTGTYTKNPLLVNIAAEHIHNDIYLYKLETKFGKDFWNDLKISTLNEEK